MRCGEKMFGMGELTQVKGGHWKLELALLATIAAANCAVVIPPVCNGTPQSRFSDSSLRGERKE
jgi:hypothetical protein